MRSLSALTLYRWYCSQWHTFYTLIYLRSAFFSDNIGWTQGTESQAPSLSAAELCFWEDCRKGPLKEMVEGSTAHTGLQGPKHCWKTTENENLWWCRMFGSGPSHFQRCLLTGSLWAQGHFPNRRVMLCWNPHALFLSDDSWSAFSRWQVRAWMQLVTWCPQSFLVFVCFLLSLLT